MSNANPYDSTQSGSGSAGNPYAIPMDATSHFKLKNEMTRSIVVSRVLTKIPPKQQGTFGPGSILRIEVPTTSWLDVGELIINFNLNVYTSAAQTTGTLLGANLNAASRIHPELLGWVCLKNGIQAIFNRIRLLWGTSYPAEDIQDYHVLVDILRECSAPITYLKGVGYHYEGMLEGRSWRDRAQQWRRLSGQDGNLTVQINPYYTPEFSVRPIFGVFNMGKYIPAGYSGLMTMEFYFNNANLVFLQPVGQLTANLNSAPAAVNQNWAYTAASANAGSVFNSNFMGPTNGGGIAITNNNVIYPNLSYTIDTVYAFCPFVAPVEQFNTAVKKKMESGTKIVLYYSTYRMFQKTIPTSWTGAQTTVINERCASLKTLLSCFIVQNDDTSFFYPRRYQHVDIMNYQFRIGQVYYPSQPVDCTHGGVEPFAELQKAFGQFCNVEAINNIRAIEYRPDDKEVQYNQDILRKQRSAEMINYNNKFFLCHNFEDSPGQLSGLDLLRMNSDIQIQFVLQPQWAATNTDPLFAGAVGNPPLALRAEVSIMPQWFVYDANGAPYYNGGLWVAAGTAMDINAVTIVPNGTTNAITFAQAMATTYCMQNPAALALPISVSSTHLIQFLAELQTTPSLLANDDTVGPWPTYGWMTMPALSNAAFTAGGSANIEAVATTETGAVVSSINVLKDRVFFNSLAFGATPTNFNHVIFTHFDAAMIIETFGTITITTDVYNI